MAKHPDPTALAHKTSGDACNPNVTGALWVDPAGKRFKLRGSQTHGAWATEYVRKNGLVGQARPYSIDSEFLLDLGWIRVVNFVNLKIGKKPSERAKHEAAKIVLECAVSRRDTEPDDELWVEGPNFSDWTPTIADFLGDWGGRDMEEKLFEGLMSRTKSARMDGGACRAEHGYAWVEPNGKVHLLNQSHYGWAIDYVDRNPALAKVWNGSIGTLTDRGWIRVANATHLSVTAEGTPPPRAWKAVADMQLACVQDGLLTPDDTVYLDTNSRTIRLSVAEFASQFVGRTQEDAVFEAAMSRMATSAARVAKSFTIDVGQPVWYGKYKNQRGVVKEFGANDKGDATVTVEQLPAPSARKPKKKSPKEMKLFNLRPRDEEDGKKASAGRVAATYNGVKFFKMDLLAAHRELNPFVGPWVFHNEGGAKKQLMATYRDLPERRKAALGFEVAQSMSGPTTVYRWLKEGDSPGKMGGASVTDDPSAFGWGANVHAFQVSPDDVMLHYKQKESWLSSKRYGHESEMILKPDARPRHLGQYDTEKRRIQAARPIKVNRGLVQATTETLIRELRKWARRNREPFQPIGVELRRPLATHKVRMDDVAGRRLTVDIHFLSKNSANPHYIVGAGAGNDRKTGNPVIVIFLNAKDKARRFVGEHSTFPEVLRNTLYHELTHVADTFAKEVQYEGGTQKMVDGDPEVDWNDYYNDPQEIRAFMREVYEQVRKRDLNKFFEVFGQAKGLGYALKGTDWPQIREHLTERNRKLFLKGVYTALQDEGLLP